MFLTPPSEVSIASLIKTSPPSYFTCVVKILNKARASISPLVLQVPLTRFDFTDYYTCGVSFKSVRHSFDLVTKYASMLIFFFPPGKITVGFDFGF